MTVVILLLVAAGIAGAFMIGTLYGDRRGVPLLARPEVWTIGIYEGEAPQTVAPPAAVKNPVLTAHDVDDIAADFVADPFMIRHDDRWYMFFEAVNTASKRGEIALATSSDGWDWTYQQVVLREPFHLSYPGVFAHEGAHYMVPESQEAHSVRLYRAHDFPYDWRFEQILIPEACNDPTLFQHDGRWWMFAAVWHDRLRLFWADALHGPWTEHPASPVMDDDPHHARPAGRVIVRGDRILRFAQDCVPTYGNQVWAFEITELTPERYAERSLTNESVIGASGAGWNGKGMHHVDAHRLGTDRWIACVDGYAGRRITLKKG